MKVTIQAIQYPYCFTKCGKRIHIKDVTGEPGANKILEAKGNGWVIVGIGEAAESCWGPK